MSQSVTARLLDATTSTAPVAYRRAGLALAAGIGLCSVALFMTGASYQVEMPWDGHSLLDAAWRIYNGERPHVDFFSQLGTLHLTLLATTMRLFGPTANVLAYMPALVAPVFAAASWRLGKHRMPALPAALCAAMTGLLVAGTYWMSGGLRTHTYAMQYNRLGWATLLLAGLYALLEPGHALSARDRRVDDAIGGAAAGLMAFQKLNYLAVAAVLLAIGFGLRSGRARSLKGFLLGVFVAALPLTIFLRFRLDAVVADAWQLAGVRRSAVTDLNAVLSLIKNTLGQELLVAAALVIAVRAGLKAADRPGAWRLVLVTGALVVGGLAVCRANHQFADIPTFALAGLLIAELARRRLGPTSTVLAASLIAFALALPFVVRDFGSVVHSAVWHFGTDARDPSVGRIAAGSMSSLPLPLGQGERGDGVVNRIVADSSTRLMTPFEYAVWVNDGLALLRAHARSTSRIFTKDQINPFPFPLELHTPKRDAYWWNSGRFMDERHHPPVDTILANTDIVMIPVRPLADLTGEGLLSYLFDEAIAREFQPRAESRLWRLLVRR